MRTGIKTIPKFQLEETKVKERKKKNQKSVKREKSSNREQSTRPTETNKETRAERMTRPSCSWVENTPVTWPPILTAGLLVIALTWTHPLNVHQLVSRSTNGGDVHSGVMCGNQVVEALSSIVLECDST